MVELLTTIAILGILSSIAISGVSGIFGKSQDTIAANMVAGLNKATREFSHSQWDIVLTAVADDTTDEFSVLRTLQWKDPDTSELNPKGPFMRPNWNPTASSDSDVHRIQWSGSAWRLLKPGTAGTGLKVMFDASDVTSSYTHPDDFTPVGAN